jgi:hypothetical protein
LIEGELKLPPASAKLVNISANRVWQKARENPGLTMDQLDWDERRAYQAFLGFKEHTEKRLAKKGRRRWWHKR